MRRLIVVVLLATIGGTSTGFAQDLNSFFKQADDFFNTEVQKGLLDYASLKEDPSKLVALREAISNMNLELASDAEAKAFYVNAYNILVIDQIVRFYYPVESTISNEGFFDKIKHRVAGQSLTLNQLEIGRLLRNFEDPRLHFVLSCAALGCPQLRNEAYLPAKLEQQLEEQTRIMINSDAFIQQQQGAVAVSMIFQWYQRDFDNAAGSILAYLNQYRQQPLSDEVNITFYAYDWTLNDLKGVN